MLEGRLEIERTPPGLFGNERFVSGSYTIITVATDVLFASQNDITEMCRSYISSRTSTSILDITRYLSTTEIGGVLQSFGPSSILLELFGACTVVDPAVAQPELEGYVRSSTPGKTYVVKNAMPKIEEDVNCASSLLPPVEVTVFDCLETMVVRYISMYRTTRRFQGGISRSIPLAGRPIRNSCVYHQRTNPLTDGGMLMTYDQDVVDRLLLSMDLWDNGDPWVYHLIEANRKRNVEVTNAFKLVDEFMSMEALPIAVASTSLRESLNASLTSYL